MGWRELMRSGTEDQVLKSKNSNKSKNPPEDMENRNIAITAINALRVSTAKNDPAGGKVDPEITPVFSKVVNEVVYFVSHNDREKVKHLDGGATYFLDEIKAIVAAKPSHRKLKLIHLGKKKFDGTVTECKY